jgi:hypothetical protein
MLIGPVMLLVVVPALQMVFLRKEAPAEATPTGEADK